MEEESSLFDQTIRKIEVLFYIAGFNLKSGNHSTSRFKSAAIFVVNFTWAFIDIVAGIYWFLDGVRASKDFLELTYVAPCLFIASLSLFKIISLMINEKQIHKLVDKLRKLEQQEKKRVQSSEKNVIVQQEKKFLHFVLKMLKITYVLLIIAFVLSPLVIIAVNYYQTKELELMLPFLVLYPFDPFQITVWPIVYLHHVWTACVVCAYVSLADLLFLIYCSHICIQFRLVQRHFEIMVPIDGNSNTKFVEDENFKNNFTDCIKWHQDVIESVHILDDIYSKATLVNFVVSSMMICLTGFNVMVMARSDLSFFVIFVCFLCMSLVQVFFLCYFADLLMRSSTDVSQAVYNSQWYMAEAKIGRKLLIVHTRSQLPCKITASGFADVNLNSFMRVLSTAYSYFALLQTMYGN